MMRRIGLLAFVVLFLSSLALAQSNCPQGFVYAGTLSGTGSVVGDFNERRAINLPENATLDTTYQQTTVQSRGGNTRARSDLRATDIPKGIHIIPYGSTDLQKGWSVSAPTLVSIQAQGATRYRFGMKLYCTVGGSVTGCWRLRCTGRRVLLGQKIMPG